MMTINTWLSILELVSIGGAVSAAYFYGHLNGIRYTMKTYGPMTDNSAALTQTLIDSQVAIISRQNRIDDLLKKAIGQDSFGMDDGK